MSNASDSENAPRRPASYADLLSRPINNQASGPCDPAWELTHGNKKRFRVGGLNWFRMTSGIDRAGVLAGYGEKASEVAEYETTWLQMPASGDNWNGCSEVQFRHFRNGQPMFFQKAALILLACELALADRIRTGRAREASLSPQDVYRHMSIIPACWHIGDFDKAANGALGNEDPQAPLRIRDAADQANKTFLGHLAAGYTVTYETASSVKKYLDEFHPRLQVGAVSHKSAPPLGIGHATEYETVALG